MRSAPGRRVKRAGSVPGVTTNQTPDPRIGAALEAIENMRPAGDIAALLLKVDDKVIDSRTSREGSTIRRRRECLGCTHRFTTYEEIEHEGLMVIKRDGRREPFEPWPFTRAIRLNPW